jgi:fused signal recognition particle receptor
MNWLNNFFGRVFGAETESNQKENLEETPEDTSPVDEEYLFDLEEKLIRLDCGLEFAEYIVKQFRDKLPVTKVQAEKLVFELCVNSLKEAYKEQNADTRKQNDLNIILIVGVNGAGKTTSIGKLAHSLGQKGQKVLIAPCDTFRAAASEQLQKWAERAKAEIYIPEGHKKPDTVLYEAIQQAKANKVNYMIVDTAGRLQNKKDLMAELARLANVIEKHSPGNTHSESLLVIDATTGQNGFQQAVAFNEATKLAGVILTKFDGSAKGGIIFAIAHNLKLPIKYLGTGEGINQLSEFEVESFVKELITKN